MWLNHSFDDKSCPVSVCKCDEVFRPSFTVSASPEEQKQTDCRIYINVFDEYLTITPSLIHFFPRLIWNSKAEEQWFELNMFAACEVIGISWKSSCLCNLFRIDSVLNHQSHSLDYKLYIFLMCYSEFSINPHRVCGDVGDVCVCVCLFLRKCNNLII